MSTISIQVDFVDSLYVPLLEASDDGDSVETATGKKVGKMRERIDYQSNTTFTWKFHKAFHFLVKNENCSLCTHENKGLVSDEFMRESDPSVLTPHVYGARNANQIDSSSIVIGSEYSSHDSSLCWYSARDSTYKCNAVWKRYKICQICLNVIWLAAFGTLVTRTIQDRL